MQLYHQKSSLAVCEFYYYYYCIIIVMVLGGSGGEGSKAVRDGWKETT